MEDSSKLVSQTHETLSSTIVSQIHEALPTTLVSQMHETLSAMNNTITSLNIAEHYARLDKLELERERHLQALHTAFSDESSAISQKRKAEREEIAERRRKEDEERERRRRLEDEELEAKARAEDEERDSELTAHTKVVEETTGHLMALVEEEAQRVLVEGREKLRALKERRDELNRLIDEELQKPLPAPPTSARRSLRAGVVAVSVAMESMAYEDDAYRDATHEAERLSTTSYSSEPAEPSPAGREIVEQTHSDDKTVDGVIGDEVVEDDVLVSRSYPTGRKEEEEYDEEELSIAELPALSRVASRDPSAEMHAQSIVVEYEEEQLTSSTDTLEEALAEQEVSLPSDREEEDAVSYLEDIREEDASFEHDDDVRERQSETVLPDTAAENEGRVENNQHLEHQHVAFDDIRTQVVAIENGDSSTDKGRPRTQELDVYSADTHTQPAPAERGEASLYHDSFTKEEDFPAIRPDSADFEASESVDKAQRQAEGFEESGTSRGTFDNTAVEVDRERSIVTDESSAISCDAEDNRNESEVHVHEVQHDEDETKEVHQVDSYPDQESESQETNSVDSFMDSRDYSPLKDDEDNLVGTDGVRGAATSELTLETAVTHQEHVAASPTSTTDKNHMQTASVSTPVSNIEFISKMVNDELDMVETSPVDILSVGSPFDGDSSFDSSHQRSHLTADTSCSGVEEPAYHDHDRDSDSEDDEQQERDQVNAKYLSDELQDHGDEELDDEVAEEEHKTYVHRNDKDNVEVEEESQVTDSSYQDEVALESHTGDNWEHLASEDHQQVTVEDEPLTQGQSSLQIVEAEPLHVTSETHHHTLQDENYQVSQENEHDLTHTEEVVQVLQKAVENPDSRRSSTDEVVDGYFGHEYDTQESPQTEDAADSPWHLLPLATSNTEAESQGFFTPLAEETPGQEIDQSHIEAETETKAVLMTQQSLSEEPNTEGGLHRTSTNGDSYVDEQDSDIGYQSSRTVATTAMGHDHLFEDDSDDFTDNNDITPTDEIRDMHDPGLQDYVSPSTQERNGNYDSHYRYERDTPVAAEVMFSVDHDTHTESTDRKDSWADGVEQDVPTEQLVEQLPSEVEASHGLDHSYYGYGHEQGHEGHEQPTEIPTASDLGQQEHDERPETPAHSSQRYQDTSSTSETDQDSPEDSFAPRDVTNVPWHSHTDVESTPMSLRSGTTLSSSPDSPIHASQLTDNHEPVIRESWPTPGNNGSPFHNMSSITGRPRTDSHLTDYSQENAVNNTKLGPSAMGMWEHNGEYQRPSSVVEISTYTTTDDAETPGHRNSVSGSSAVETSPSVKELEETATSSSAGHRHSIGGSLFQRMRSVFETHPAQPASPDNTSPTVRGRSRATSNLFTSVSGNPDPQQGKVMAAPGDGPAAFEGLPYDYGNGYGDENYEDEENRRFSSGN